jgi:hypothetical protein
MGVCAALSGTFDELVGAAEVGVLAERAVFPILRQSGEWLSLSKRDRLWDLFHVPIYAVRMDSKKRIEAFECEAQDGMHLADWLAPQPGLNGSLCDCGRPGARVMGAPRADAAD